MKATKARLDQIIGKKFMSSFMHQKYIFGTGRQIRR